MLIKDIILEIEKHQNSSIRKSVIDIFRLLENNKNEFLNHLDERDYFFLLNNFENLANTHPKDYETDNFKREYLTHYNLLLFYLNRIF